MSVGRKKLCLALCAVFVLNIAVIALVQWADAAVYKKGSSGNMVSQIQQKLSQWGYYSGSKIGKGHPKQISLCSHRYTN